MVVAIAFLILALLDGIFRLMADNGLATGILASIYELHPILMVFGFLAIIVMTERVAGISIIPEIKKSPAPLTMVPLVALGVVSELFGYTIGPDFLRLVGGGLLLLASLVFILILFKLASKTGIKLPFYFMIVSAVSLAASALLSSFSLPTGNSGFIMLLLSFPLVFILGERVELTRFTASLAVRENFRFAFYFSCIAVASFVISSLQNYSELQIYATTTGSLFLLLTVVVVLFAENKNFKLLSKSREPLQKYVISHTKVAYSWGIFGLVLAMMYFADSSRIDLYDPFIHSIAVGFIGTMLLAHGPIIFPSVTGKRLDVKKISLLPLVVLTAGNLIRVVGDLVLLANSPSEIIGAIVGLSGWLILIAMLLFVRLMLPTLLGKSPLTELRNAKI